MDKKLVNQLDVTSFSQCLNINSIFRKNYQTTSASDYNLTLPTSIQNVVSMSVQDISPSAPIYNFTRKNGNVSFRIGVGTTAPAAAANAANDIFIPEGNWSFSGIIKVIQPLLPANVSVLPVQDANYVGGATRIAFRRTAAQQGQPLVIYINFNHDEKIPLQQTLGWELGFRYKEYTSISTVNNPNPTIIAESLYNENPPSFFFVCG